MDESVLQKKTFLRNYRKLFRYIASVRRHFVDCSELMHLGGDFRCSDFSVCLDVPRLTEIRNRCLLNCLGRYSGNFKYKRFRKHGIELN